MQNPIVSLLFTMLVGFSFLKTQATTITAADHEYIFLAVDSAASADTIQLKLQSAEINAFVSYTQTAKDSTLKKKAVSALLALPFPFGFMGAHRVMLGCKPWVPVVYVATFGGCFGLLPLIDFFVIAFSKDISQYENNPHIFMWIK